MSERDAPLTRRVVRAQRGRAHDASIPTREEAKTKGKATTTKASLSSIMTNTTIKTETTAASQPGETRGGALRRIDTGGADTGIRPAAGNRGGHGFPGRRTASQKQIDASTIPPLGRAAVAAREDRDQHAPDSRKRAGVGRSSATTRTGRGSTAMAGNSATRRAPPWSKWKATGSGPP